MSRRSTSLQALWPLWQCQKGFTISYERCSPLCTYRAYSNLKHNYCSQLLNDQVAVNVEIYLQQIITLLHNIKILAYAIFSPLDHFCLLWGIKGFQNNGQWLIRGITRRRLSRSGLWRLTAQRIQTLIRIQTRNYRGQTFPSSNLLSFSVWWQLNETKKLQFCGLIEKEMCSITSHLNN